MLIELEKLDRRSVILKIIEYRNSICTKDAVIQYLHVLIEKYEYKYPYKNIRVLESGDLWVE